MFHKYVFARNVTACIVVPSCRLQVLHLCSHENESLKGRVTLKGVEEFSRLVLPIVSHKTVFIISVYDSVWIFKCESASNNPDTSFHRV